MTTSEGAFVWTWLPGATEPVVAGRLEVIGSFAGAPVIAFSYGRSYLQRADAISLYAPELPLAPGTQDPSVPLPGREPSDLAGCIRDGAPDAWGRRVLNLRLGGDPATELSQLTYLLSSSSDRIGALDFQESATTYLPRGDGADLDHLVGMVDLVEAGEPIPDDLAAAAGNGSGVGGAQPKALLRDRGRSLIAKFSSSADHRPVVKAEAVATLLAARVGISVPAVEVIRAAGRDVLLVERFDRFPDGGRRSVVSALTILGLTEQSFRYATYPMLADAIKGSFRSPAATLRELYLRLVFNVCIGNTDDHPRNHAAFWDGHELELTPAYDLTPQPRSTGVADQAMALDDSGRRSSQLWLCREAATAFHLTRAEADALIDHVVATIRQEWEEAADQARLTRAERDTLFGREILNPYVFYERP